MRTVAIAVAITISEHPMSRAGRWVVTHPRASAAVFTTVMAALLVVIVIVAMVTRPPHYNGKGGAGVAVSQNGYPVIFNDNDPRLYRWHIPGQRTTFLLRRGPAGLILAQHAYWYSRVIGGFDLRADDHGYGLRHIDGTNVWSNHASGTAIDINAYNHPQGYYGSYTNSEVHLIEERLELMRGVLRWGGNYNGTPDEMHVEIIRPAQAPELAAWLKTTYYGKKLLAANPGR